MPTLKDLNCEIIEYFLKILGKRLKYYGEIISQETIRDTITLHCFRHFIFPVLP